jgi:hypothetical protein
MKNIDKTLLLGAVAATLLAVLLAGCSTEEVAQPTEPVTVTDINVDGTATLDRDGAVLTTVQGNLRYLDYAGNVLAEIQPSGAIGQTKANGVEFANHFPGIDLELREAMGGVRRLMNLDAPVQAPAGAYFAEFVDYVQVPEGMTVKAGSTLKVDNPVLTGNGFVVLDANGNPAFTVPAPAAWDATGRNRPWMQYRLDLLDDGTLEVGTRIVTSWMADADAIYPLTIDPTVTPGAPEPFVASGHLSPVAPYDNMVNLSVTYSNAYNDTLEIVIEWDDNDENDQTFVTNMPLQLQHTYADGTDGVTVTVQVSDFTVDENGDPAPRTVRETLEISLLESTDDTIPPNGGNEEIECGFEAIDDEDDLDWSDDSDDDTSADDLDDDEGTPLGFEFVLDGKTYTHFSMCSDGWVQLLDGNDEYFEDTRESTYCDWIDEYSEDGEGGAFIFCAYDDWDAGRRHGFYGFKLEDDSALFYWDSMTYEDSDEGEDADHKWQRSVEIRSNGEIAINFGPEAEMEDNENVLYTGLYLPDADAHDEGTFVNIAVRMMPFDACYTYPGEYDTVHTDDLGCDCEDDEEEDDRVEKKVKKLNDLQD